MKQDSTFGPYLILMRANIVVLILIVFYLGISLYQKNGTPFTLVQSANAEAISPKLDCGEAGVCGSACCKTKCTKFNEYFCSLTCDHFGITKTKHCECINDKFKCVSNTPSNVPAPIPSVTEYKTYLPVVVQATLAPTPVIIVEKVVEQVPVIVEKKAVVYVPREVVTPVITPVVTAKPEDPICEHTPMATLAPTPVPTFTVTPYSGCGTWGCAENGRTGETADRACNGWGPNTATTRVECKEAVYEPASGLKGLCIVVEKNFCPGQVATSSNACSCMGYGSVSCGLYGCADSGRSGETADRACNGWGPDTAHTKYECQEGKIDPVTHKKGLCAVVGKNYCPGVPADRVLTCGCF